MSLSLSLRPDAVPAPAIALALSGLLLAGALAWSAHLLRETLPAPPAAPAATPALDSKSGSTLFGSPPDTGRHDAIQLVGILALDPHHAAAVISNGTDPARVVGLKGRIDDATTLTEIHPRSIVIEHNGVPREISLSPAQNPAAFVR